MREKHTAIKGLNRNVESFLQLVTRIVKEVSISQQRVFKEAIIYIYNNKRKRSIQTKEKEKPMKFVY